jgi:hypothetical protein
MEINTAALKINSVKVTPTATQINSLVQGVAATYVLARGTASVTGTANVVTGLATVAAVVASIRANPALTAYWVSAALHATPGTITLKVWKPTSAADVTPLAGSTAADVDWVAIGTLGTS